MAEGHPTPAVSAMLQQAASKRLQGVRTVLVTPRSARFGPGGRDASVGGQRDGRQCLGPLEIVEADYDRLAGL